MVLFIIIWYILIEILNNENYTLFFFFNIIYTWHLKQKGGFGFWTINLTKKCHWQKVIPFLKPLEPHVLKNCIICLWKSYGLWVNCCKSAYIYKSKAWNIRFSLFEPSLYMQFTHTIYCTKQQIITFLKCWHCVDFKNVNF